MLYPEIMALLLDSSGIIATTNTWPIRDGAPRPPATPSRHRHRSFRASAPLCPVDCNAAVPSSWPGKLCQERRLCSLGGAKWYRYGPRNPPLHDEPRWLHSSRCEQSNRRVRSKPPACALGNPTGPHPPWKRHTRIRRLWAITRIDIHRRSPRCRGLFATCLSPCRFGQSNLVAVGRCEWVTCEAQADTFGVAGKPDAARF